MADLLHEGLLKQAENMLQQDSTQSDSFNARRAISTAYYALFHMLIYESMCLLFNHDHLERFRSLFSRSFEHKAMKKICDGFKTGNIVQLPQFIRDEITATKLSIPEELKQ